MVIQKAAFIRIESFETYFLGWKLCINIIYFGDSVNNILTTWTALNIVYLIMGLKSY